MDSWHARTARQPLLAGAARGAPEVLRDAEVARELAILGTLVLPALLLVSSFIICAALGAL